jgi:hypothetical protein
MMPNKFYLGLDLGQAQDYSALAILERQGYARGAVYHCRHLQRWPLRTSYMAIVSDTARMVNSKELQPANELLRRTEPKPVLAVDATGVGAPVIDLFKAERMNGQLEPIQITGGSEVTNENGTTRVPKRDLVSSAQVALQNDRLQIAAALPDAQTLIRELQNFQVKITDNAHDTYGAWREGTNDDLVLAVALALWIAENGFDNRVYVF